MNGLFAKMRLAPKLMLMLSLPMLVILLIGGQSLYKAYHHLEEEKVMTSVLDVAAAAAKSMHALMEESEYSREFLAARGKEGAGALQQKVQASDKALEAYAAALESVAPAARNMHTNPRFEKIDEVLSGLDSHRIAVRDVKLREPASVRFYEAIAVAKLELLDMVPWESPDQTVGLQASVFKDIEQLNLLAAEEWVLLAKVFERNAFAGSETARFDQLTKFQTEVIASIRGKASPEIIEKLDGVLGSEAYQASMKKKESARIGADFGSFAFPIDPAEWTKDQTQYLSELSELGEAVMASTYGLVDQQIESATTGLLATLAEMVIALVGAGLMGLLILRNVRSGVQGALSAAEHIADGDLDQAIETQAKDEVGDVVRALANMRDQLKARIEADAKVASENLRIRTALDGVSTCVMMSDEENRIVYMNDVVRQMFIDAEEDIRTELPQFSVDKMMGSSIDVFHKDPSHQQRLVAALEKTVESEIKIGGRTFAFSATPVNDPDGHRQGTAVQWIDRTAEVEAAEAEQERLEAERKVAQENARIRVSLDNASSNVMLADNDGHIIYMNKSANQLFSDVADDLRTSLPNFDENKLIGVNIDTFHKDPSHQRRMLEALQDTYVTEIEVGKRTMKIVANPVVDDEGVRLGTAVEWSDRTQEVAVEREIDGLVESASQGDLSRRILLEGKSGFFKQLGTGFNSLLDELADVFDQIANVMSDMADGRLDVRIKQNYQGTFGKVKDDINQTLDRMGTVIGQLDQLAGEVDTAAEEIYTGNNNLSARTEQQASSLEETAASMEELTSTVRNNADNSRQADQLAANARNTAEAGGEVVSRAVDAMEQINTASAKISEIIGVIDEIAFQTNLLALNASVEAARAGEQGRGFAVVATEVRNLASRSADAAKEIKELIRDSVEKVEAGSQLVNESGTTLEEIVVGVKKVGDIVAEISAASAEQAAGIDQINQAVTAMDEMTQQNAALAEETSAASQTMTDSARQMTDVMGFFKGVGEVKRPQRAASVAASTAPPAAATAPAAKPTAPPPKPAKPKASPPSAQAAEPIAIADDVGDEWEEF